MENDIFMINDYCLFSIEQNKPMVLLQLPQLRQKIILNYVKLVFSRNHSVFRPFVPFVPVFRIRISFHADPDPGSQKFPCGSGSESKEVNTKEE